MEEGQIEDRTGWEVPPRIPNHLDLQGVSNGGPLVVGWGFQPGDPKLKVLACEFSVR